MNVTDPRVTSQSGLYSVRHSGTREPWASLYRTINRTPVHTQWGRTRDNKVATHRNFELCGEAWKLWTDLALPIQRRIRDSICRSKRSTWTVRITGIKSPSSCGNKVHTVEHDFDYRNPTDTTHTVNDFAHTSHRVIEKKGHRPHITQSHWTERASPTHHTESLT